MPVTQNGLDQRARSTAVSVRVSDVQPRVVQQILDQAIQVAGGRQNLRDAQKRALAEARRGDGDPVPARIRRYL